MIESVHRNLFNSDKIQEAAEKNVATITPFFAWMEDTADLFLAACSNLSAGLPGAADEDDVGGWLPLSLAVRIIPVSKKDNTTICGRIVAFKSILAYKSIQICLGKPNDWEGRVGALLKDCPKGNDLNTTAHDSSKLSALKWRCIAVAEIGLSSIGELGDEITGNGPRFLSLVELVGLCVNASTTLFATDSAIQSSQLGDECSSQGLYGSVDDARRLCQFFEQLEGLCVQLKKKVTCVFIYPHLRRVKELLAFLAGHFRQCKTESGDAKRKSVQKSMDGWIVKEENIHSQ